MKHKLNSFSGAFEGTTKGLEGIANALKREEPTPPIPPGPYVPIDYPIIAKFGYLNGYDIWDYCIKRFEDTSDYEGTTISGDDFFHYGMGNGLFYVDTTAIPPSGDTSSPHFGSYDENFNISLLYPNTLKVEWIDPSTLPQS